MIIFLINYFTDKTNEFKRRNRNRPSYYRYFLIWLSLIILFTAIFYNLGLFNFDNNSISENIINEVSINSPNLYKINSTLPINKRLSLPNPPSLPNPTSLPLEEIKSPFPAATVIQTNAAIVPQTSLYDEVLKTVGSIPPPLKFVDDYKFEL